MIDCEMLPLSCMQVACNPQIFKVITISSDQLQDLQASVERENAEPLIKNDQEFHDDDSRALN